MIEISAGGNFKKDLRYLNSLSDDAAFTILDSYGKKGVLALQQATPVDTGLTASSWSYEIVNKKGAHEINWFNTAREGDGPPIAILIQYGHATRSGSFVLGYDYINPALQPLFDKMAKDIMERVRHG